MLSPSEIIGPLKLVATLVNDMDECNDLCKHVHECMTVIHDKLFAMETQETLPPDKVVRDYSTLVNDFRVFLTKHKSRPWVYRVVMARRVTRKVQNFQERITTLKLALDLIHMGGVADERAAMEAYRAQQAAHDADVIAKLESALHARLTDDATVTQAVLRVEQQYEALSVLVHELDKLGKPGAATSADDATAANERLLTTALNKVIRRSKVPVRTLPRWFCSPNDAEFDVTKPFAGGSFGTVHYGRMDHMDVVVKCLLVDTRTNMSAMKQFFDEASLWFDFRHRNVLLMYGACDVSSPPFIVCELAANGNLFDFLSFESNRPQTLRLLHEAASGLAYLHSKRVVHGDLKGDNILVTDDGCAKVADFSFSYMRALSASRSSVAYTSAGGGNPSARSAGAIRWRAPECLRGRSPTFASDVFSFGMCIIEVVGQVVPWGHYVDDVTVRELVKEGELPERPADMSDRVWDLVARMCSLDPRNRPSLTAVLSELSAMIAADEVAATSADSAASEVAAMSIDDRMEARVTRAQLDRSSATPPVEIKTLEQAIADDDVESVTRVLSPAASLEEPVSSSWNAPPLIVAAATGATNVTKMLLARGANANALLTEASAKLQDVDDTGCTALHVAAYAGHARVVEALLTAKRDLVGVLTKKKRSAMYFAARFGHVAVIKTLLWFGADLNVCEVGTGATALSVSAEFGQLECVRALLQQHNVSVHTKNRDGSTALHQAVAKGHADVIEVLLRHGARIEEPTNAGSTPLHWSAYNGQAASARVLLQHKANVHAKISSNGSTALHQAVAKGHADVIEELLRHGARIEDRDNDGRTPLHSSAYNGQAASARVLLQHKANVHAKISIDGSTALHQAASEGHVDVIDVLLRHGARIEDRDNAGSTPLHWSALFGQAASARVLLAAGAVVTRADVKVAKKSGHWEIVQMLEPRAPSR